MIDELWYALTAFLLWLWNWEVLVAWMVLAAIVLLYLVNVADSLNETPKFKEVDSDDRV